MASPRRRTYRLIVPAAGSSSAKPSGWRERRSGLRPSAWAAPGRGGRDDQPLVAPSRVLGRRVGDRRLRPRAPGPSTSRPPSAPWPTTRVRRGAAGERAYLCRESVEVLRNAWAAGHERDVARDGPARRLLDARRDDVRASLRQWRRRPAAAAGGVGTLGMAVAAVVTTFGLLTAVLWRPLPFPHDERLVFVWESASDERGPFRATSARFSDWERG